MLPLLTLVAMPLAFSGPPPETSADAALGVDTTIFQPFADRESLRPIPELGELSKKSAWLADKARRYDVHMTDRDLGHERREKQFPRRPSVALRAGETVAPGSDAAIKTPAGIKVEPLTTLFNLHTHEALPLVPGCGVRDRFHQFLRDYTTNQATHMDERLIGVLERVALRFSPERIEVVSGYRSPKYNLMLRKKGHEVAKSSEHSEGHAVDFRVRGVPTRRLLNFVKSLRLGGVGYYPHSEFVHSDTGRIRFWRGT